MRVRAIKRLKRDRQTHLDRERSREGETDRNCQRGGEIEGREGG